MLIPHCSSDLIHSIQSAQGNEENNVRMLYLGYSWVTEYFQKLLTTILELTNLVGQARCKRNRCYRVNRLLK